MTPDELPADMEAVRMRLGLLARDLERDNPWQGTRSAEDASDIRDLLKAYQEQRRAFRALFESISCDEGDGGLRSYGFNPSFWEAYWEAEAALNQKGDEQ